MAKLQLVCQRCGKRFEAIRSDALYCTDSHRQLASRDKRVIDHLGKMTAAAIETLLHESHKAHRHLLVRQWLEQIKTRIEGALEADDV